MPVSRLLTEGLADDVAAAYARAEVRLLRLIAESLADGAESPQWAEQKIAELQTVRARARRIMAGATAEALDALLVSLTSAYTRGLASGQGDADALGVDLDGEPPQVERQVAALYASMREDWQGMELQVVRATADAYRDAVVRASSGTLTGAATRLQDAQVALNDLAGRGVTGFVDKAGRRWALPTYVEMATRSVTTQAAVSGHLDRLEQAGIPLVLVSNSSRECELCRPWEGKVLSRGPVSAIMVNAVTGRRERVDVDGTVAEATSAGLFHPSCTHSLSAFIPGATRRGDATSNAKGYAERQEQRRLERKVREWKRRQSVALTPEEGRRAAAKVREWQGQLKAHTDASGLPRKRNRESLTAAR